MTWMRSFTDMRLAIATRLGVEEGDEDYWYSLPEDDPRAQVHDIYDWLGYLQETLVEGRPLTAVRRIRDASRRAVATRRALQFAPRPSTWPPPGATS